jgi:hypothetical protein
MIIIINDDYIQRYCGKQGEPDYIEVNESNTIKITKAELSSIGKAYFKHICDASSPSDCKPFSEYFDILIALSLKGW